MMTNNEHSADVVSASPEHSDLTSQVIGSNEKAKDVLSERLMLRIGAPCPHHWHNVNWKQVNKDVRGLQVRIVRAVKESRWNKVKSLQRTLTRSQAAKLLAVRRVVENKGHETPGVDGECWTTPEAKLKAVFDLNRRDYIPKPLRRIYIPKANGERRPLGIPTMKDRAMQALHLLALEPVAETISDKASYGFRPKRSAKDAGERLFKLLSKPNAAEWILDADIHGCFDHISHEWLLKNVPMDKEVLKKWLDAGYMEDGGFHLTEEGTPQGGIISPVLANLTLNGMETVLKGLPLGSKRERTYPSLTRYADDFIVSARSKEHLESKVIPALEAFLKERGLELSEKKTRTVHISEGFDFLGWNFRKYQNKFIVKPSDKSIQTFRVKADEIIKEQAAGKSSDLVNSLNLLLVGWKNYHNHVVASEAFKMLDDWLFHKLWRWAERRHRNQNGTWIARRYFHYHEGYKWKFFGVNEKGRERNLIKMGATKIWRHPLIKKDANPYDPAYEIYFEQRLQYLTQNRGNSLRMALFKEQKGICPHCGSDIAGAHKGDLHHLTRQVDGGTTTMDNLVLLHPNCHRQIHSLNLHISKPVPAQAGIPAA